MKKLFTLVLMILLLSVVDSMAAPMPVAGDLITIDYGAYHEGNGGEFTISGSTSLGTIYSYTSFCLETNEYFYPGHSYTVESVTTYAANGGVGGAVDNKDYVSDASKWLMNEYVNNNDSLYDLSKGLFNDDYYTLSEFAGDVQNAIWYMENEIQTGNVLTEYILDTLGVDRSTAAEDYLSWVQVLNLVTMNADGSVASLHQSQLVAAPVPEPATMVLLGTGVIGLAGMSRRKIKK
jgi:hypothetical protein